MADTIPSLWPQSIKATVLTPLAILRTQAYALRQVTKGVLEGKVSSVEAENMVEHQLDAFAPALDYRHRILSVRHEQEMAYPATVRSAVLGSYGEKVSDDDGLTKLLAKVLGSDQVRAVIASLIARSNEQTKASE
jgi:hypothetical protein